MGVGAETKGSVDPLGFCSCLELWGGHGGNAIQHALPQQAYRDPGNGVQLHRLILYDTVVPSLMHRGRTKLGRDV